LEARIRKVREKKEIEVRNSIRLTIPSFLESILPADTFSQKFERTFIESILSSPK
jgi:hypothetical protein